MGILRDFEKRLEGAVEGFFARAFRSGLQPVELAKALQRYATNYQQVGIEGVFIPNVYRFALNAEDMERFSGFSTSLQRELGDVLRRTAAQRRWQLQGPVRISFDTSDDVRVGTYELRGKVEASPRPASAEAARRPVQAEARASGNRPNSDPSARPSPSPPDAGATRVLPQGPSGRTATLQMLDGARRRFPVAGRAVIGRLPECDVTLDDPSVSRRHAIIRGAQGEWAVQDLDSTNGLRLNGETVTHARLVDGDRLELGAVTLAFSLED